MTKRFLPLLLIPLLLSGCTSTFTNLTPTRQVRTPDNSYPVEFQLNTRQQSLRWHTIKPYILVGNEQLPMRPTPLMKNRWEGLVPVPAGANRVEYRYKIEYDYNAFGARKSDSALSPKYELKVLDTQ
jgi:hypothetical protein